MSTPKLGNCPNCGKLFLRIRNLCDACIQKQEEDYQKAAAYLREHPGCTIQVLSEATGVSMIQIRQFILAGRILADHFPNLSYPCELCGSQINTGKICGKCMKSAHDLKLQVQRGAEDNRSGKGRNTPGYISKYL